LVDTKKCGRENRPGLGLRIQDNPTDRRYLGKAAGSHTELAGRVLYHTL